MKKRIFWCFQQLHNVGGTEVVTLHIIRLISNEYEIHIVPFSPVDKGKIIYKIPDNVIIEDIGFPDEVSQFDLNFANKIKEKHYLKALIFLFKTIYLYTFGRYKYKRKLTDLTTKNDVIIIASSELMLFAPKKRHVIQHFHYNSYLYNNSFTKLLRLISRKPDEFVFLTKATQEVLKNKIHAPSTFILNPCRFNRELHLDYNNNTLITVARLEAQKDPMLLLRIAKELDNRNFKYTYNIYGTGSFKGKMLDYIKENNLKNVHVIEGITELAPYYAKSDLYIMGSKFEGIGLTCIEANSLSVPLIWVDVGDPTSSFIIEGQNGYIVHSRDPKEFADKIIETLSDKDKLITLKKSAFESSKRFDEKEIKKNWENFLDKTFSSL